MLRSGTHDQHQGWTGNRCVVQLQSVPNSQATKRTYRKEEGHQSNPYGQKPSRVTRKRRRPVSDRARICWQFSALIPPRWPRRGVQPSAGVPAGRPRTLRKLGPFTCKKRDSPLATRTPAAQRRQLLAQRISAGKAPPREASPLQGAIPHAPGTQLAILPAGLPHISRFLFDLPLHHPARWATVPLARVCA